MGFPVLVRWHLYIESEPRKLRDLATANQFQSAFKANHWLDHILDNKLTESEAPSSEATNVRPKLGDNRVNLASISLDMYEKSILEKGPKFILPPQQVSKEALIHGGKQFARNIKLAQFFHNKINNVNDSPKMFVHKPS